MEYEPWLIDRGKIWTHTVNKKHDWDKQYLFIVYTLSQAKTAISCSVYCISKLSQRYMFNVQGDKTGHLLDCNITMEQYCLFLSTFITMVDFFNSIAVNQQAWNTLNSSICFSDDKNSFHWWTCFKSWRKKIYVLHFFKNK